MVKLLMPENVTLAELLLDAGYQTVGIFTNPHHHKTSGFWQGFEEARYLPRRGRSPYAGAWQVYKAFFDWYDHRRRDEPYFAYLHFMDVHLPYRPPREFLEKFLREPGGRLWFKHELAAERRPTEADLLYMQDLYDASIAFVDRVIQQIFCGLEGRQTWQETVIVVTSDHGEEFMDHGGLAHGNTLEKELIRIPIIFHRTGPDGPRRWPVQRVSSMVRNLDLAPTLLELAGSEVPQRLEGVSLVPLLEGSNPANRSPRQSFAWVGTLRSLTTDRWHLIISTELGPLKLYDNQSDPKGFENLKSAYPETITELSAVVEEFEKARRRSMELAWQIESRTQRGDETVDPEIIQQLEALGYLE